METPLLNNKVFLISCFAVLTSLLIAFTTSLIAIHSAPISSENDMYGIIVYFKAELFLRPVVAMIACFIILQTVNLKLKQTNPHPDNPKLNKATVMITTFVLNAMISTIQFLYIWK